MRTWKTNKAEYWNLGLDKRHFRHVQVLNKIDTYDAIMMYVSPFENLKDHLFGRSSANIHHKAFKFKIIRRPLIPNSQRSWENWSD